MNGMDFGWVLPPAAALLAGCLLLVPLGAQVLARGVVFIDLAVAQMAACGALAPAMLVDHPPSWLTGASAAVSALLGAALVCWLSRRWPPRREALIGLIYVAGASLCVIVAGFDPHGRERLAALLAADVLWVSWSGVAGLAVAAGLTAAASRAGSLQRDAVFYPLFALAMSVSVPHLGLYLVFAFLVAPGLWASRGVRLRMACLFGGTVSGIGLAISWAWDLPSGACIAIALSILGIAAGFRTGHSGTKLA